MADGIPDSFYDQDLETDQGKSVDPSDSGVTDNTPEDDDSGGYTPPSNYSSSDGHVGDDNDWDGSDTSDDDDSGSGYTTITNDGTDSTVNDADSSDGSDGSDTWGNDSDGSDGGDGFDTDTSTDDGGDDPWSDSGTGGGYTTITNDSTDSTVNDTDPVQGDDASDYEDAASDGIWGEGDGSAPDNSDGSNSVDVGEQIDAALAEQRAAYEAQMASLMESMPVPDQLGGADSGGGLSPVLGGTALLLVGAGALYVGGDD